MANTLGKWTGVTFVAGLVLALTVILAPPAAAGVPYSWWCYAGRTPVLHTSSSYMVGYVTAYRGWRCVGGFYSNV